MKKDTLNKIIKFLDLTVNVANQVKDILTEFYPEQNVDTEAEQAENSEQNSENNVFELRLDSSHFYLDKSYKILTTTADWLINEGKLKKEDCPIYVGAKNNVLLIDKSKNKLKSPKELSNGLWIRTNFHTEYHIRYAKELLKKYGYSEDIFEIKRNPE
jgi:hypothetical protein